MYTPFAHADTWPRRCRSPLAAGADGRCSFHVRPAEQACLTVHRVHGCRQRRDHLPDGRRVNKWLLIDQHEQAHLAVQGQERDARDGHYVYGAVEPFSSRAPMPTCTNQQQVMHWLEQFISHHAPKSAMHVGDHIRTVRTCPTSPIPLTQIQHDGSSNGIAPRRPPVPLWLSVPAGDVVL